MLAERIGLCAKGSTADLLAEADEIGRMVRTLLTRLSPKP